MNTFYLLLISLHLAIFFPQPHQTGNKVPQQYHNSIDTTIEVSYQGKTLRYYQYIPLLKTGRYTIAQMIELKDSVYQLKGRKLIMLTEAQQRAYKMDSVSIKNRIEMLLGEPKKMPLSASDTAIIVYDVNDRPLRFYQYSKYVYSGKYHISARNGKKHLEVTPPGFHFRIGPDSVSNHNKLVRWLSIADKIIVEKGKRKMYLERNNKIIFTFPINLGKTPIGAKSREGDGRTPEGLYNIDYNINTNAAYYKGFHISYPNPQDVDNAKKIGVKPGGDIMIHGTSPQRSNLKDWTNGCIAISNRYLDTLTKYIYPGIPIDIRK